MLAGVGLIGVFMSKPKFSTSREPAAAKVAAAELPSIAAGESASLANFLNRDLSWLEFNRRVLAEAADPRNPTLERLRFLGIFSSNLDEFFMKRVSGMRQRAAQAAEAAGLGSGVPFDPIAAAAARASALQQLPVADGRPPPLSLSQLRAALLPLLARQADIYSKDIRPQLAEAGVHLLSWAELTDTERATAYRYFQASVFPVLTPLAVDPGSPFPFISNLSTSLGVVLHHPDRRENVFARVKIPDALPQWLQVGAPSAGQPGLRFVSLAEIIRHNLHDLFPDLSIVDTMAFRITRDYAFEMDEEETDDLRELVQAELRQRRFANVVRLEHGPDPNPWIMRFLMEELGLQETDIYELPAELNYDNFRAVAELPLARLRFEPWTPINPPALGDNDTDIFATIRRGDVLVHHPYESFSASVQRFLDTAAADPKVLAIKMTLYRTGEDSPLIHSLIRAAEARKQVVALVELQARFDEERNMRSARALESAGAHVLYGVVGLKTHAKVLLVVRQEADGIRSYVHTGTGNYHAATSRLYTDFGLFTCDPDITRDVVELFHYLTGRSRKRNYRKLLVAPVNMRDRILECIEREIDHANNGRPAHIIAKMNQLEERKVCGALYAASQAGVRVDLIVRGFCTLRPGVPGLSDNIRVTSVIGRFLEHSRVFYYRNGAANPEDGEFYIGSADWMYRNLLARVEAVTPVQRPAHRQKLYHLLQTLLDDYRQAWDMQPDGSYVKRSPRSEADIGSHMTLMLAARREATEHVGRY